MKQCIICGKGTLMVGKLKKLRGKYNPTGKKRKYPNLQWVKLPFNIKALDGKVLKKGERIYSCVKCIKRLDKT